MRQRIKERIIVWKLTLKRTLVRKSFWLVILLLPVVLLGMQKLEAGESKGLCAVVYTEDKIWQEQLAQSENPTFYFVDSMAQLEMEVLRGNAECGYHIPEELLKDFAGDDWYWKVEVYESPQSMFTEVINEALFRHIFQVVSSEWYLGYMEERLKEAGVSTSEDKILQTLSKKLLSDETFRVETIRVAEVDSAGLVNLDGEQQNGSERKESELDASQESAQSGSQLSVRGVVAVMIYLTSLLAMMDVVRDREKNHFPMKLRPWAAFCTLCIPTFVVAFVGMVAMLLLGVIEFAWGEILDLVLLVLLSTFYGMGVSLIVRKERWMYGVIPVLFVASLICCPVFVDLERWIPVFGWIEKLFPVAFYL